MKNIVILSTDAQENILAVEQDILNAKTRLMAQPTYNHPFVGDTEIIVVTPTDDFRP